MRSMSLSTALLRGRRKTSQKSIPLSRKQRPNGRLTRLPRSTGRFCGLVFSSFCSGIAMRSLQKWRLMRRLSLQSHSAGKFVNGVLGTVYREIGEPGKEYPTREELAKKRAEEGDKEEKKEAGKKE